MQATCPWRTSVQEGGQAEGGHGAAVQECQQRARHMLLPTVALAHRQQAARQVRGLPCHAWEEVI